MSFNKSEPEKADSNSGSSGQSQNTGRGKSGQTPEELVKLHKLAVDGDKEAVKAAHELAKQMHKADPQSSLAEAYMGSTISLMGRDAIDPNERFKLAIDGVKRLDKAVSNDSDNTEIRILRGYVNLRLPEMYFHRTNIAIEDLKYLVERYEENNRIFTSEFYWQLLYDLGTAYKTIGNDSENIKVWSKLAAVAGESGYKRFINPSEAPLSSEDEDKKKISEGAQLHKYAVFGGKKEIQQAYEYFDKAYKQNTKDPLFAAYYADCMSRMGMASGDSTAMFANAIKAMKLLDEAVNMDPGCLEARLLRADHSYRLPEAFFKRTATTITDLEYLTARYENDSSVFSKELYLNLLHLLGKAYLRMDMANDARKAWQKLLNRTRDVKYKKLAEEEIKKTYPVTDPTRDSARLDKNNLLQEGIRLHDLAVAGNPSASRAAYEVMKSAFEIDGSDPMIEGYYASSMALMARDSSDTTLMFTRSIKAIQHLKHAISRDISNPTLRLLRGYLTYNMPEFFFHMSGKAAKDFKFLKTAYEQNNSIFPEKLYWQILYDLGVCYMNTGDTSNAAKIWNKLLETCPDPKYKAMVRQMEGRDNK